MRSAGIALTIAVLLAAAPARAATMPQPPHQCVAAAPAPGPRGLHEYVGALHEHSAYSDGYLGSIPETYYRFGRCNGLSFLGGSDHSDTLGVPIAANDRCIDTDPAKNEALQCLIADPYEPARAFRKWSATQEQADRVQDASYTTLRGFEWSSDRFGHVNVYGSRNEVNAQLDGSLVDLEIFYRWAERAPSLGGGADGLLTFNHPGDKSLCGLLDVCAPADDPGFNWNDFAYEPALDRRTVGIEVFNGSGDFAGGSGHGQPPEGWYAHALDKGWHLGAIGAEDLGHHRGDDWGGPTVAKTVLLARDQSRASLRAALLARRAYATRRAGYRLDFTVAGALMGSRLRARPGEPLDVSGALRTWKGEAVTGVHLDVISNGGAVVASSDDDQLDDQLSFSPPPAGARASRWYFLRARVGEAVVAYSSPVWVSGHRPNGGKRKGRAGIA